MLSSLSWNTFFTTVALLAGGYYAITSLLLYRTEITNRFKTGDGSQKKIVPASKPVVTQSKAAGIMGNINHQDGLSSPRSASVSADDFVVGVEENSPEEIELPAEPPMKDDLLIGTIADLLEEVKTVCQLIADSSTDEQETESMFRTLLARYPHIAGGSFRDAVTLYICKELNEQTSFVVSQSNAALWWQDEPITRK